MDVGGQTPSLSLPLINLTFSVSFIPFCSTLSLTPPFVTPFPTASPCSPSLRFSLLVALTSEENLRLRFLARKRGCAARSMLSLRS